MNDAAGLVLALGAGVLLGMMFYGGLWWTVKKGLSSEWAASWFLGSLVLRTGLALVGFYLVSRGDGLSLPVCLLGFILARLAVTRFTRASETSSSLGPEASHAP